MKYYLIQENYNTNGKLVGGPIRITGDSIDKQWIKQRMDAAFNRMLLDCRNQIKPGSIRIADMECSLELPGGKYVLKIVEAKPAYSSEDVLMGLVVKYKGEWSQIFSAINKREPILDELDSLLWGVHGYITLINEKYPLSLKSVPQPPFALFYKNNIDLLSDRYVHLAVLADDNTPACLLKKTAEDVTNLPGRVAIVTNDLALIKKIKSIQPNRKIIMVKDCGLDCNTEDHRLLNENDLIITEVPHGNKTTKDRQKRASRIIAGIASHLLIANFQEKSTICLAVTFGLYCGREILVYPTLPEWRNLQNNKLISEGAELVENANDITALMAL